MSDPLNISTDDALFFSNNMPDSPDDSGDGVDTEDPTDRGQSQAGRLDMFRAKIVRPPRHGLTKLGNIGPIPYVLRTPGASQIP